MATASGRKERWLSVQIVANGMQSDRGILYNTFWPVGMTLRLSFQEVREPIGVLEGRRTRLRQSMTLFEVLNFTNSDSFVKHNTK